MGDAALAKEGTESNYLNYGVCLMTQPGRPCLTSQGHYLVETWDCGMVCCIYPDGNSGIDAGP
jgi:hypothetical protein